MSLIVSGVSIENLIVINSKTGEQVDVETLQEPLGNILFQKQTAPEWLNYTAMDSAGNLEGTTAYTGTPAAYAIGKPTISSGTATYAEANGLNEEYFSNKYGSNFVKSWDSTAAAPLQCVEDVLVIPDTYNGLPITKILDKAFTARTIVSSVETRYQPYFYTNIVFGKNITTIGDMCFAGTGDNIALIDLPETVTYGQSTSFGDTKAYNSAVRLSSALKTSAPGSIMTNYAGSIADKVPKVIYSRKVTYVFAPTTASGAILVFEHQEGDTLSINYGTTMIKNAITTTIYAEHDSALYYTWETGNITPTFYHLDGTLWTIASVTRSVSGEPLNNLVWTISGDADYFIISKDGYEYRYNGAFSVNPLVLFSNTTFCMNMYSYSPVIITAYKAGCMKKEEEFTVSSWNVQAPGADGTTTSQEGTYGLGIGYNTTTDEISLYTNTKLQPLIESYNLECGTKKVNVAYQGNLKQTLKVKNYASQLGLVVGTEYSWDISAKLKGLCTVYTSTSYTSKTVYGGN